MNTTTIIITPTNATPSLERDLIIRLPVSPNTLGAITAAEEVCETLDFVARPDTGKTVPAWDVLAILDVLTDALARVSMPQVMGNGQRADSMRLVQRMELDEAHEPLYTYLRLHGYDFFCQNDQSVWLQIGHWAQTKLEAAQFPQRPKWEAARIAYERLRALQREAESKERE